MALIKCEECGHSISKQADACPNCGHKKSRSSGCTTLLVGGFVLFLMLFFLGKCSEGDVPASAPTPSAPKSATLPVINEAVPPEPPTQPRDRWRYQAYTDEMTGKRTFVATVQSTNALHFDFPYNQPQTAMLTLRTHPRHGKDAIVSIDHGQFLCRSYEDCDVLVRFDDGEPQWFSAAGPSDGGSTSFFIRDYSRFVSGLMRARTVRIAAEVYDEGRPILEFDVEGFDKSKYLPSK